MNPLAEFFASNIDYSVSMPGTLTDDHKRKTTSKNADSKSGSTQNVNQRVCDRCIVKKVKCDMKQPSCARCLEVDVPCNYSVKKRKPGPLKGSKHARRRTSKDASTSHKSSISEASSPDSRRGSENTGPQVNPWQFEETMGQAVLHANPLTTSGLDLAMTNPFVQDMSPMSIPTSIPNPLGIPPSHNQQKILLDSFFLHIHPSIPLFHKKRLIERFEAGTLSQHLLLTICVVTAKLLGMSNCWDGSSLDDCTVYLLDLPVIENEGAGRPLNLDNFHQGCILAFYAFHQFPGEKSWMRIGNLTRKAYQCGLHQIDFQYAGSTFNQDHINSEDLEEWRYVWWCIYCLDSYSNVTAITPFIVEVETVKTALVSTSLTEEISYASERQARFLPDDTDMLWKTAKEVTTSSGEINFNMHILTTTLIREAATIHRLRKQSTSKRIKTRLADLEDHFSAFRLALPARYMSASRNALSDETNSGHHARLICVLHIHLARILTYFPLDPQEDEAGWFDRWQKCLESVTDIVTIVKQWDSQYFTATDPAICFIISFSLNLLHLQSLAADIAPTSKARMENYKAVLKLFLEQFASAWSLPRFLLLSFEQFTNLVRRPLSLIEIDRILKVSVGSINYRWLNFLSLSADFESLDSPARMYENLFTQEWDSNEWEAIMPIVQA